MGRKAYYRIPHNHYNHRPNTSNADRFFKTKIQISKVAKEKLAEAELAKMNDVDNKDMNAEQMAFEFYPYLGAKDYLAYCKDPFH